MIIILGLIILVAAIVVAVSGILGNGGSAHAVSHFSVLGYHLTGSAGTLFLTGIVVGAAGLLGLSLLLAGARRTSRRGSTARRGLAQSRRETAAASQDRDDLIGQRDTARAYAASQVGNGTELPAAPLGPSGGLWSRLHDRRRRPAHAQNGQSDAVAGPASADASRPSAAGVTAVAPAPDVPVGAPAADVPATTADPAVNASASVVAG